MTVEELHSILKDKHEEIGRRLTDIQAGIDKINGRVGRNTDAIWGLKVRDAFWAGGVVAVMALIKLLMG